METKKITNAHDRFLFWLEGCKGNAHSVRFSWERGKSYTGEIGVNLRNKKREFEQLNNAFKGEKPC